MILAKRRKLSSFQIIILGFLGTILLGSALLALPISTRSGVATPFIDCLFTSTSAVCVTGLVVVDTAIHWSIFGQIVILLLIQIGGLGVVVVIASLAVAVGKNMGLFARDTIKEAISAQSVGGVEKLVPFVVKGVFIIELIGAVLLMPTFCTDYGAEGIWLSIFHSISAFCNAGFDIMGTKTGAFSSMTGYASNPLVTIVLMLLIIIGGIGFLVWEDVVKHKFRFKKYRTQSKIVLITTLILILIPSICYFIFEFNDKPFGERLLLSIFQAVTPRTAGFNTANLTAISGGGCMIMIILMIIGGSPGSTAGGMKTTTFAVLISSTFSVFKRKENVEIMKRGIDNSTVKNATAILVLYLVLFLSAGGIISEIEGIPLSTCLFETASAIGTVGLTLGITPTLSVASQIILMILMFVGRVGGLTVIFATARKAKLLNSKLPIDKIMVG